MRRFAFIGFLVLCISSVAQKYQGDSWSKTKASGTGTLAVLYYEQAGLISKSKDGQLKGVCVDILLDFAKFIETKYGKKVTIKYVGEGTEFPAFLKSIQTSDNVLGVTNTSITEDRKKVMKFTPPFMNSDMVLLTNKNVPTIKSLSDVPKVFKGFTGQVIAGSTHVPCMEKIKKEHYPELKIETVVSGDIIVKNLASNQRLFSIIDFTEYVGIIRNKMPIKRHEVQLCSSEALGFIMSKHSDWDEAWNEFLTPEYRKSVRYKEIIATNLGQSFLPIVR